MAEDKVEVSGGGERGEGWGCGGLGWGVGGVRAWRVISGEERVEDASRSCKEEKTRSRFAVENCVQMFPVE